MLLDERNRVLSVWAAGFLSDEQVSGWAERVLMSHADPAQIPTWLLELVEHGPGPCFELEGFGRPPKLDFPSQFSLHAVELDLASDDAVSAFARWAAGNCLGEDLENPVVRFGYYLDHLIDDCGRLDWAVAQVREDLPGMLPACRARASLLLDLSA